MNDVRKTTSLLTIISVLLKELRVEKNLHQAELAEMCDKTASAWNKIESGKSTLSMETFLLVCKGMQVSASSIMRTAEGYAQHMSLYNWAITSKACEVDDLSTEINKYYSSEEYKESLKNRRGMIVLPLVLNTPSIDMTTGDVSMIEVFHYVLGPQTNIMPGKRPMPRLL